jgi:hypothetical protein
VRGYINLAEKKNTGEYVMAGGGLFL